MDAINIKRQHIESIDETLTDLIFDVNIANIGDVEVICANNGFLYDFDELDKLAQKAKKLFKVISRLRENYDTGEFNRWMNSLNDERRLMQRERDEAAVKAYRQKQKGSKETNIYLMLNERTGHYKIGHAKDPAFREKTLMSDEPQIKLIKAYVGRLTDERAIHKLFADKQIRGEWFALEPADVEQFHGYFNDKRTE